jgi:hypothetical protein
MSRKLLSILATYQSATVTIRDGRLSLARVQVEPAFLAEAALLGYLCDEIAYGSAEVALQPDGRYRVSAEKLIPLE